MTSGPDRSITGGISLPKWMKTRISDRAFDFEGNAFSPPTGDDGFFLIRYKKVIPEEPTQPKIISAPKYTPVNNTVEKKAPVDITKHTTPCQDFIPNAKKTPREIGLRNSPRDDILKSTGIDDGFKGEGAACGYSVVAVAHQMIAERNGTKDELSVPRSQRARRNSKSLPASPLSSPKLLRKNPYFTNILFGSTDKMSGPATPPQAGSIDGSSDDLSHTHRRNLNDHETSLVQHARSLRAKPSELREMNFWSPTSM
ncbi:uncharacterized protein [Halyomorpha halys]|uniref:uncharacterized protein isoform X2 n=1 Tax=Halyomorpha halys TaxID=286706 RepID=UPI0006D516D7|nr:uncharacterized protein LOC106678258 [Halyomorpha halys]